LSYLPDRAGIVGPVPMQGKTRSPDPWRSRRALARVRMSPDSRLKG